MVEPHNSVVVADAVVEVNNGPAEHHDALTQEHLLVVVRIADVEGVAADSVAGVALVFVLHNPVVEEEACHHHTVADPSLFAGDEDVVVAEATPDNFAALAGRCNLMMHLWRVVK